MRALIQRVLEAEVRIEGEVSGKIGEGFLILLGVHSEDEDKDLDYVLKKTSALRVFEDENGKMNVSPKDKGAEMLVVSQFTLCAQTRKGNRPSFVSAAKGEKAEAYYEAFVKRMREEFSVVETGEFGADMKVSLINDGPVTILIDSREDIL